MYGIPEDFPHDVLSGAQLLQICFGENDLILNFSEQISILVTSSVSLGSSLFTADFVQVAVPLLSLLGKQIVRSYHSDDRRILSVAFSDDETLSILDDSVDYESCIVTLGGSQFII